MRDILCILAASGGVEREFSVAAEFDQDNRAYSAKTLSDLMICNYHITKQNLEIKKQYYLHCRVETIVDDDIEEEIQEAEEVVRAAGVLVNSLKL